MKFFVDVDWSPWLRKASIVEGFMQQLGPINRDDTCKLVLEGKGEEKKKKKREIVLLS